MSSSRPERPRHRLDPAAYQKLRLEILERDGWRCQRCGTRQHLEVHHQTSRSHSGMDCENNLVTLCDRCHRKVHSGEPADR